MKNFYHKKRISILTGRIMGQGGTETVLSDIAKDSELNKTFDIDMFITEHPGSEYLFSFLGSLELIHKVKIGNNFSGFLRKISIIFYLITTRSDIIIGMKPRYIQIASKIKRTFHKKYKVVSWIHFSLNHMPGSGNSFEKMKEFLPMADAHLAISSGIADELTEIGISPESVSIIYNPLSKQDSTIYPVDHDDVARFVYVGRLYEEQKNIIGLLKILSNIGINFKLDVFGTGVDEEYIHKIGEKLFGKNKNIVWHGWTEDPWKQIDKADALLLTSNYEGFPMTLLESISRGLPVVSYDCPTGPKDIVKDGENGYLVPMGSQDEFRKKVLKVTERKRFANRNYVKNSLEFLYGEEYSKRFKSAINDILEVKYH